MVDATPTSDHTARIAELERENAALTRLLEAGAPEGYSNAWIAEQVRRSIAVVGEEDLMKLFRVFGNRVLMEFGDREGMRQAFADAEKSDNAEPVPRATPLPPAGLGSIPKGWTLEVVQNDFETQLCLWGPGESQDAFFAVPCDSAYAEVLRAFAGTLERIGIAEHGAWEDIRCAPADELLLLAAEMDGPGDWRMKVGGYWDGRWHVFGASWKPTRFMRLPAPPSDSARAERCAVSTAG